MTRMILRRLKDDSGFTMVGLLISTVLMGLVSLSAMNFYQQQHAGYLQQTDVSDTQQNLRATMDELTRQIRVAGYRTFGAAPIAVNASGTKLLLRYNDGTGVRTKQFYLTANASSGRNDLVMALDTDLPATFAEGIDSVLFTPGGTGTGIQWVTVDLVAKSAGEAFQSAKNDGTTRTDAHLYRRLSSKIAIRNRS